MFTSSLAVQVPGLGAQNKEWGFPCGISTIGRASLGNAKEKTELFPPTGKQCTINCSRKWKSFSRSAGRRIPYIGILMGNFPASNRFSSGSPIAKVE
jgi:hypothetical protein